MRIEALKRLEDPVAQLDGNTRTMIDHRKQRMRCAFVYGDLDIRVGGTVPDGVGQEVQEDLFETHRVGADRRRLAVGTQRQPQALR